MWRAQTLIGLVLAAVLVAGPAGQLPGLRAEATAPSTRFAAQASAAQSLDQVAAYIRTLPDAERVLAGEAGAEGHWRLINRQGETFSASTAEEFSKAIATLAPDRGPAQSPAALALHVTDESVFRHPAAIARLPTGILVYMRAADASFRIMRNNHGPAQRIKAELRPSRGTNPGLGIFAEVTDRASFDELRRQLDRPLDTSRTHLLALEPGADAAPPSRPAQVTVAKESGKATELAPRAIDPDRMRRAFGALRRTTALFAGRIEGERLVYQPSAGIERGLLIRDFAEAAAASDVDLVILGSASVRQPGTRNWLWLRNDIARLGDSFKLATAGDMLAMLIGDSAGISIALRLIDGDRAHIVVQPAYVQGGRPFAQVSEVLSDVLANVTATASPTRLEAYVMTSARRAELDRRIVPGVASVLQFYFVATWLLGLLGWTVARRWWQRIWPRERCGEYGGSFGYRAAQFMRELAFAGLFLPIAGPIAFLAGVANSMRAFIGRRAAMPEPH